jgi:hypothetical protein
VLRKRRRAEPGTPWWRTTRAFAMTLRALKRRRIDTAAQRPRPNWDRLLLWLNRKLSPTWPALFPARITSPTKVFGRLAPRLPLRTRCLQTLRECQRREPAEARMRARGVVVELPGREHGAGVR